MAKDTEEWLRQADYDMEAAEAMFKADKHIYAVFMCHLSIEKALKGCYYKVYLKQAPKVHDLLYLIEKCELKPPDTVYDFLFFLSGLNVPIRYPDELERMRKFYGVRKTKEIIEKSQEVLKWIKEQLNQS